MVNILPHPRSSCCHTWTYTDVGSCPGPLSPASIPPHFFLAVSLSLLVEAEGHPPLLFFILLLLFYPFSLYLSFID